MSNPFPTQTPNVSIKNPNVRRAVRTVLDVFGALVFIAWMVDVSTPAFDIMSVLVPCFAGYAAARSVFGFGVDNPNTPTFSQPQPPFQGE